MKIVRAPKLDNVRPRLLRVFLGTDPSILLIAGKDQVVSKLCPHKTLMIVGGRVDQMAQNLTRRPRTGRSLAPALVRTDVTQTRSRVYNSLPKILEKLIEARF